MRRDPIVIVGAGVAGLACAIWLARDGRAVTVLERAPQAGGKMREVAAGPSRLDGGPTVFTLKWVFDDLFEAAGSSLDRHLVLDPLAVLARHAWSETERLDLYADAAQSAEAIGDFAGAAEAAGYRAFQAEAGRIYATLRDSFLTVQKPDPIGLSRAIGLGRPGALLGLRPFETMQRALEGHFRDPRLRQLFGRYATYCGASPYAAPATLMLIAHVEQCGVWTIRGGMQRLAEAMTDLAQRLGVTFHWDSHVSDIKVAGGRAVGVALADGAVIDAAAVVANVDAAALARGALGRDAAKACPGAARAERSLSAVTWAMEAETSGFDLDRHNVFFSTDYRAEFDDLFKRRRPPVAPTLYVCAQDRPGAHAGPERLLMLINAAATGDRATIAEEELRACETRMFDQLARCGLRVARDTTARTVTTPMGFEALFPGTGGALYGRATHGWSAAFDRPGARTRIPGLYLAGGGAHPGAGVPMAALSGKLAAQALMADRASM